VAQRVYDQSVSTIVDNTATFRQAMTELFANAVAQRTTAEKQINEGTDGFDVVSKVKTDVLAALTAPAPTVWVNDAVWAQDGLTTQAKTLSDIDRNLKGNAQAHEKAVADLVELLSGWASGDLARRNAMVVIFDQLDNVVSKIGNDIIQGKIGALIDFNAVREDVERRLRALIPSRITRSYDLDASVGSFANIFIPDPETRLTLRSRATVDLLSSGPPQITATGALGPFKVHLLGDFMDICTLRFDGARFGSDTGGKLKTNIVGFEPGAAVEFLQQLSSFLSFGANGFYLRALFGPPGIEAGYRMPPAGFALGALGVSNLSLNIGVVLPFTDAPALFKVGMSTPEAPFLINVGVYGGGGHLALYASPAGIMGFEASFEFGAVVSFSVGPLVGQGRVTAGIFLRSFKQGEQTVSTVEGYVTAAGAASIACFHVCAMLQVRVGQLADGSMAGTATFTFSFSVGLVNVEFRITAQQKMGKGFSSTSGVTGSASLDPSTMYAENEPPLLVASRDDSVWQKPPGRPWRAVVAELETQTVCKGENYAQYESYFDAVRPTILNVW
jgi:hypothetical protein